MLFCAPNAMAKGLSKHEREHLRQLCALNTMVGTAPSCTKTAGLFGKGSEEHGQTMPAVLVPNGQNFWTPQTRESEAKCLSPYYYTDTRLQGFRGSHWTSGSCTQDYGSFTIATLGGKLRKTAKERATSFRHEDEVSHPHYYAVRLPDEHLLTEMTASSHAAIFRITPEQDGPVHIVVEPNSDEKEGRIEVEPQRKTIYACNPVHRIYQGWGESAGFSGHLLLTYTDEPIDCGQDSICAWLTFQGKAGKPIVVRAATSFTGREGAERNYKAEAQGVSFDKMKERLVRIWIRHLHAIDVEDPDTARVNQFYGALYRASFMPHEMSDADGAAPRFGQTPSNSPLKGENIGQEASPLRGGLVGSIVSNPPYICESEASAMDTNVLDHEPHLALFVPDHDPLLFYRAISEFGKMHLADEGQIFFEVNSAYAKQVEALLREKGYKETRIINDQYDKERFVCARKSNYEL